MVVLAICAELLAWALLVWILTRLAWRQVRLAGGTPSWSTVWKIGAMAALPLVIFWEWLPTWVAYKQYSKQAGFTVHKSLEQWRAENPGVAAGLERFDLRPKDPRGQLKSLSPTRFRTQMNQRIASETDHQDVFPNIRIWTYEVIDVSTGSTLARYVNVTAGNQGGLATGGPGWWKFWAIHGSGGLGAGYPDYSNFREQAATLGRIQ